MFPHVLDTIRTLEDTMARKPRATKLENRTARLKLPVQKKSYFTTISPGIALGYRRNAGAGVWSVRAGDGHGAYWLKRIAIADDHEEANGDTVLTYWEAIDKARALARGDQVSGDRPATVSEAIERYEDDLRSRGGRVYNARLARIHLPAVLLGKPVGLLSASELRRWRDSLLEGRSAGTVNRTITTLRAALELACSLDPRITNREAFRTGLQKLRDAGRSRNVVIGDADLRRLIEAAYAQSQELGLLVETGAVTGARRSSLARLTIGDLQDGQAPRLLMPTSVKGKGVKRFDKRPVPIPDSLAVKLRVASAGRSDSAPLLVEPGTGVAWAPSNHWELFREITAKVGLDPNVVTFNALRHSSITRQLLNGTPVRLVAQMHDTSVSQIEATYSKYIGEHGEALYRRGLLDLGAPEADNVTRLRR
jgi:integrase